MSFSPSLYTSLPPPPKFGPGATCGYPSFTEPKKVMTLFVWFPPLSTETTPTATWETNSGLQIWYDSPGTSFATPNAFEFTFSKLLAESCKASWAGEGKRGTPARGLTHAPHHEHSKSHLSRHLPYARWHYTGLYEIIHLNGWISVLYYWLVACPRRHAHVLEGERAPSLPE